MRHYFYICILCFIVFNACDSGQHQSHQADWSYSGENAPEHWAEIEKHSDCGGQNQSPINIIASRSLPAQTENVLDIYYSDETILHKVDNNGHSIQFSFEKGDSIVYNNKSYHLKQIHFHEHSEHLINGMIYPIEIHLVHMSKDNEIAVIAILGQEGEESQIFEFFESFLPLKMGESKLIDLKQDLNDLFPDDRSFFSYVGSLTTPPCTENVNWIVFKESIILSLEEVEKLRQNMPLNNYRNEQALNGRKVYFHQSL